MKYFIICALLLCIGATLIASQYQMDLYIFKIGILLAMLGMLGMFGIERNDINKNLFKIESDIIHINGSIALLNIRCEHLDKRIKQIDIKIKRIEK